MALRFRFSTPQQHVLQVPIVEDSVRRRCGSSSVLNQLQLVNDQETAVLGTGFRFGSTLLCVTAQPRRALIAPTLILTNPDSSGSQSMNVHTRFVRVVFNSENDPSFDESEVDLLAMLLDDNEIIDAVPDLSTRFSLFAPVGSTVLVRGYAGTVSGHILDRERLRGNFRYVISLNNGQEYEGSPVFVENDLIGVVVRAGPGVAFVLGLEPIISGTGTGSSSFFSPNRSRTSYREAILSLLPEPRSRMDVMRETLDRPRLFVQEADYQMT